MNKDINNNEIRVIVDDFNANRPFNRALGLVIKSPDFESSFMTFHKKDEFVGNPIYGNLHGGVISSVLDVAGGHAVCLSAVKNINEPIKEKIMEKITKVNTIVAY